MKKILIAAGGTGGHIMPALGLADGFKALNPGVVLAFAHGPSVLENRLYARRKEVRFVFSVGRLHKNISHRERFLTLLTLPFVLWKALKKIRHFQPDMVLGMGGAVTGPVLLAAWLAGKKTILFEPNATPGLTNRLLKPFVTKACVVFEEAGQYFKHPVQVPFPVRKNIQASLAPPREGEGLRVLVLGGSQGSHAINKIIEHTVLSHKPFQAQGQWHFVHQCGEKDFPHLLEAYRGQKQVRVFSFIEDMNAFYSWADFVICRSGMSTLAELSFRGKAALLVPLPSAASGHQMKNARLLEARGAALVMEESRMSVKTLKGVLEHIHNHPEKTTQPGPES